MSDLDSTIDQMESPQRTPSKRKAYTIADKLEVIDRIHKGETHMQVSKAIHVPESTVRGWLKDEEQLRCIVATRGEAIKQQQRKRGKRKKQKNQPGIAGQINEGEPQKEGPDMMDKVEPQKEGPDQINAGEPQKGGPGNTDKGEPQKKGKNGPYATDDKGMSEQAQADSGKSVIDLTDKPQKLQLKGKPSSGLKDLVTKTLEQPKKSRFRDGRLVARMKEYLAGLNNKNFVSIPLMADYLQNKYPEYRRKKKGPFVQYVDRAYFSLDKGTPLTDIKGVEISSEEEEEDEEELVEYKDTNSLNSMMSNLYKSSPAHASNTQKRQTDCPSQAAKRLKVATETEKPEKVLYPSPDAINRNLSSTGLVGPRRSIQDRYFIDRKGEERINPETDKTQANNSREATIKEFLTGLPSRTSFSAYVNTKQDPRLKSGTLYKVYKPADQPIVEGPSHSGITGDNQGVSIEPPSSPGSPMSVTGDTDVTVIRDKDTQSTARKEGGDPKSSGKEPKKKGTKRTKGGSRTKRQDDSDSDEPKNEKGLALQKSSLTFADVGGNDATLTEICKLLVHMRHPEVYSQLGITPPRGFLLHGPPGCGKTLLANAIAGELDLPLLKIAATEIVSGVSGDSEQKVRELFDKALQSAPCVVFIDEIDSITPKRETASKDMERRIVAQLLACMDDLNSSTMAHVLVIGATNRPDSLDPALRRAGRFDREICLGIPDEHARRKILEVLCRPLKLCEGFEFNYLAKNTPGYVGADLMALSREAAMVAVNRVFQNLQSQSSNLPSNHIPAVAMDTTTSDKVTSSLSNEAAIASQSGPQGLATHEQTTANCDTTNVYQGLGGSLHNGNQEDSHNCSNSFTSGLTSDGASGGAGDASCSNVMAHLSSLSQSVVKTEPCDEGLDNTNNSARSSQQNAASESSSTSLQNSIQRERRTAKEDLFSVLSWLKEHPPLTEEQLKDLFITMDDFKEALQCVQPSAKREGFATIPDVSWEDIGALQDVREELQLAVLAPVRHAEEFQSLGLCRAQGVLLAGPPGCGKTLLAKAVANESGINFISVKGPELLNMYVGESERAVRTVFQRARNSSPCVIFFDELDALCPRRSGSAEGGSSARVVNQLLTEMDGLEERKQVFIMAATNRPDIIDPAILRPGRLDKTLYVGLPTQADRRDILTCITKNGTKPLLAKDVDINQLASDKRCDGFTGADLAALVREASVIALKEAILNKGRQPGAAITVTNHHFQVAFTKTKPSVSAKDQEKYKSMREKLQLPDAE